MIYFGICGFFLHDCSCETWCGMKAQGEAVLRKALDELNVWGYERKFTLVEYSTDQPGTSSVPLVKEWTQLMTEVGDNQSLAASLGQSPYFHLLKVHPNKQFIYPGILLATVTKMNIHETCTVN